jgi:acyl phosphate:glycerol-3-phosphate acyltransferase
MHALPAVAIVVASYALGSVSFAYLAAKRLRGIDLRTVGSGNLGATNASRVLGRGFGIAIYALDFLKGLAPVVIARRVDPNATIGGSGGPELAAIAGLAAFLGHCYPAWHGFRGGKGVATASGMVLALSPIAGLVAFVVFGAALLFGRMISLGSVLAATALAPAHVFATGAAAFAAPGAWTTGLFALVAFWVIARHRSNLARIFSGTEAKIGRKVAPDAGAASGPKGGAAR